MSGFIQGEDRSQATLFPERLDDYVPEDSAVRVIDVFIDELDLSGLGFKTQPNDTGRPACGPIAARGSYSFFMHLKWTPVKALGYGLSIWVHLLIY